MHKISSKSINASQSNRYRMMEKYLDLLYYYIIIYYYYILLCYYFIRYYYRKYIKKFQI